MTFKTSTGYVGNIPSYVPSDEVTNFWDPVARQQSLNNARAGMLAGAKNNVYNQWNPKQGFWDGMWNNMTDYVQKNPYEAIGGALNVAGDLWTGYQNYKNQKNQLALAREQLALQQQAYNDSNARAQEAWNLQKRQLRSSSL